MAKLTEPVMAQISVVTSSSTKTLIKQEQITDIDQNELGNTYNPRSVIVTSELGGEHTKIANGHLGQIIIDEQTLGASSEEISTASTEIVCVRAPAKGQSQRKRDLRIRSHSADRILEEEIKFTRVAISIDDENLEKKQMNGNGSHEKRLGRQISDRSYLSWQDSETSGHESLSNKQDSLSTRQESISIRQDSLSHRQDSHYTRQESVPSRPESSASQGVSNTSHSPMLFSTRSRVYAPRRDLARRYWGRPRSYTALGAEGGYWGDLKPSFSRQSSVGGSIEPLVDSR